MRIGITGRNGQVATALREAMIRRGDAVPVMLGRPDFDLLKPDGLAASLAGARLDLLVNTAAYTAVDLAEENEAEAFVINAEAPGRLAEICHRLAIPFIQLSTDYVFDGEKGSPYLETDTPRPRSAYGRTKLEGERRVAAASSRHVILRTAWVYSHSGRNFVRTMLDLARQRREISVVADQHGSPTSAADLATAILTLAPRLTGRDTGADAFGLFHLAGGGETNWAGFAEAIFRAARSLGLPHAEVVPISTTQYPRPAPRPADSRLECSRIATIHDIRLPDWREGLETALRRIAGT